MIRLIQKAFLISVENVEPSMFGNLTKMTKKENVDSIWIEENAKHRIVNIINQTILSGALCVGKIITKGYQLLDTNF